MSRKCLFFKSVWLSLSTCYCGLTSLLNARDCFPSFHKDVKQLRSHETLQTGEYIFVKGLLNISTLMLEETISRLEQDFATSPIIHYLILNVKLSFNFLDNSLLYLFHRDFHAAVHASQGFSRCFTVVLITETSQETIFVRKFVRTSVGIFLRNGLRELASIRNFIW